MLTAANINHIVLLQTYYSEWKTWEIFRNIKFINGTPFYQAKQ